MIIVRFLVTFIIVYLGNYFFNIRKAKKLNLDKCPRDVLYFIQVYKININKVNYRNLLKRIGAINALIIAITYSVVTLLDRILLVLLTAPLIIIPLIIISYKLLGIYYKKKGFVNNV